MGSQQPSVQDTGHLLLLSLLHHISLYCPLSWDPILDLPPTLMGDPDVCTAELPANHPASRMAQASQSLDHGPGGGETNSESSKKQMGDYQGLGGEEMRSGC